MEEVLHANVFFFITSIAVVLVTALLLVSLVYVIQILRRVRNITDTVRDESMNIAHDLQELRRSVKEDGVRVGSFFSIFSKMFSRTRKRRGTGQ